MRNRLMICLGLIYRKVPRTYRPYLKMVFLWLEVRLKSILYLKKIYRGKRIEFIDYEIANLETHELLGPGKNEVLIESYCSAVSPGTETAVLLGLPGARRAFPYTPGYSVSGIIAEKGSKVTGLDIGDRVAGRLHHMDKGVMKCDEIFRVPDSVSFEDASMIELGIITFQGIRKAQVKPGDRVAIVGQGLIGQICNLMAKMLGAVEVIAVANSRSREKTALQSGGADLFISAGEKDNIDKIQADVVIEAVGQPQAIGTAIRCAKDEGRVVLLGSARGLGREVNWLELAQKRNIVVVGAHISALPIKDASANRWTYRQEGELFLKLLQEKRLKIENTITWRAKPEDCNRVYEILAKGGGTHVGIIFHWNDNELESTRQGATEYTKEKHSGG